MHPPYLTEDGLKSLVVSHAFHHIPATSAVVCVLTLKSGFRVFGTAPGPLNDANFSYETGCNYAYETAFKQLWQLEGYHQVALAASPKVEPVNQTEDMKLPDGSAVFQVINCVKDGQPGVDLRGVLIGGLEYDPENPAHRILGVMNNRIGEIVQEATGGEVVKEAAQDIELRLVHSQETSEHEAVDPVSLSRGTPAQPVQQPLYRDLDTSCAPQEQRELAQEAGEITEDEDDSLPEIHEGKGGSGLHRDD